MWSCGGGSDGLLKGVIEKERGKKEEEVIFDVENNSSLSLSHTKRRSLAPSLPRTPRPLSFLFLSLSDRTRVSSSLLRPWFRRRTPSRGRKKERKNSACQQNAASRRRRFSVVDRNNGNDKQHVAMGVNYGKSSEWNVRRRSRLKNWRRIE